MKASRWGWAVSFALLFVTIYYWIELITQSSWTVFAVVCYISVSYLLNRYLRVPILIFFSCSLFIFPILGSIALNATLSSMLWGVLLRSRLQADDNFEIPLAFHRAWGLILSVSLIGLFYSLRREIDFEILRTQAREGGPLDGFSYVFRTSSTTVEAVSLFFGMVLTALLSTILLRLPRAERSILTMLQGLAFGAVFSLLYLLAQIVQIAPFFTEQRDAYWISLGRYSASFTDPNAFGVVAAISSPLLFFSPRYKLFSRLIAVLLILGALWSGSRTLFLFLGLFAVSFTVVWLFSPSRVGTIGKSPRRILIGLVPICVFLALLITPITNRALEQFSPAPALTRLLQTFNAASATEMFGSRVLFSRIAISMWREHPLSGVGLARFKAELPSTYRALGLDLGDYRDNANNFYLHILAEHGFFGFLAVLAAFLMFRTAVAESRVKESFGFPVIEGLIRQTLAIFSIVLLTGPHVHFDEVRHLVGILLMLVVLPKSTDSRMERSLTKFAVVMILAYLVSAFARPASISHQGFYGLERDSKGVFVWTGAMEARLSLCRLPRRDFILQVKLLHPDIESAPVSVSVSAEGENIPERSMLIADRRWHALKLKGLGLQADTPVSIKVSVDRLWNPKQLGLSSDNRFLGAMVRWPEGACG